MPTLSPIINAFNAGELSPRMYGRTDINKYLAGLKTLLNFNIHPQGGVQNRSGTRFVHEVYDSSKKSRVVRFVFSVTQAYILEFSDQKIRVFKDEGYVLAPSNDFEDGDVNVAGDHVEITGGHWYEDEQGPFRLTSTGTLPAGLATGTNYYIVKNTDTQLEFSLTPGGASVDITGAAGGGTHTITRYGDVLYEMDTPYLEAELFDLRFAQSADTLYIVHQDHEPAKITREDHDEWEHNDISFQDGPYLDVNTTVVTIDPSGVGPGVVTLTASASTFKATDVGRMFRWFDGTNWFWGLLENYVNTTTIDWDIEGTTAMAGHVATTSWRLGAWGTTALGYPSSLTYGYPSIVTFHEQRLVFAANPGGPQTIYGSVSGDYENFAPTTEVFGTSSTIADDNAITYKLAGKQVNVIRWMNPTRSLVIGTPGGVWPFQATSLLEPITPTNVNTRRASPWGSAAIEPVNVSDLVVAVSLSGLQVFSVGYDFDKDTFVPQDLTLLSPHITKSGVVMLDEAREPNSMIWAVRDDGVLASLTYFQEQQVAGWGRHILGGSFGSGDAVVESIAVIPSPSGDPSSVGRSNIAHDQVWLTVKRTINGATYRSIEFFEDEFADDDDLEDAFFVDCGLTYNGAAVGSISSGLGHLEGESVKVLADGAPQSDKTVTSGAITLDADASKIHIGLDYNSDLETLRIALPDPQGSSQGKVRRPVAVVPLFHNTLGGQIGRSSDALDPLSFRGPADPMDAPPPLYSGFLNKKLRGGYDKDGPTFIRQNQPLPMTILSMIFWMESTTW